MRRLPDAIRALRPDRPSNRGANMSDANHFRKWAAQVARQAGEEPDAAEAQRLLSVAEYWVRLADNEESDRPASGCGGTETRQRAN